MHVSILAMLFEFKPVLIASLLSALLWNYFFIPPIFTFHISNTEDLLLFLLYFFIALVNAVLTYKIRQEEMKSRDKEEKVKAIKLYNTVLNSLSHELRTPISTIIGSADALEENRGLLNQDQELELLKQIQLAGVRLNRQVENLLYAGRLENGMIQLHADWHDIHEVINWVIQKSDGMSTHQIEFEMNDSLPLVMIDRGLMEQVLQNLLQNAIQYSEVNTIIRFEAAYVSDTLKIRITDQGKGIPDADKEKVFEKFYRVANSKAGGSGLGLAIAKGFAEAHGGKVSIEYSDNLGSCFVVEIPALGTYLINLKNE